MGSNIKSKTSKKYVSSKKYLSSKKSKKVKSKSKSLSKSFSKSLSTKSSSSNEDLVYQMAKLQHIKPNTIFSPLYVYSNPIHHTIIRHDEAREEYNRAIKTIGNYDKYEIPEISYYYKSRELPESLLDRYSKLENQDKSIASKVKKSTEGFARGIAKYVMKNYKLQHPISNGFTKLWEILHIIPQVIPNKSDLNLFHLAEAPGQWIHTMNHYFSTSDMVEVDDYDWRATSLNAKHPTNIKKYGKDLFGDIYGFIANWKENWIWGADNTGDIINTKNQKWYKDYVSKWLSEKQNKKVDVILGDGGLGTDDTPLIDLQKLELAQLVTTVSVGTMNSNCIIKHFLPYYYANPDTIHANGFYTSLIFIYCLLFKEVNLIKPVSSSPNSSEFYVVCMGFNKKIGDILYPKLLECLENLKENECLFPEDTMPKSYVNQFLAFIQSITNLNDRNRVLKCAAYTCLGKASSEFKNSVNCSKYLSPVKLEELQDKRFKMWVKKMNFV